MAKVPVYDAPQVTPSTLPGARQTSIASPTLFSAEAEQFTQLGAGLQNAGNDLAKITAQVQDRTNADKLFQAETAFKDDLIKFDTEQRSKKGAAALADGGVTQQTDKWFGESVAKHSQGLDNDVQRRLFTEATGRLRLQTLDTMSKHQAAEARNSLVDSTKATIVGSINLAAANPHDWTVLEAQRAEIIKRVDVLTAINGGDKPGETVVRDALRSENLTLLHKQMLQEIARSNPGAAKAYFEKYKEDIAGSQRAELGILADKATANNLAESVASRVWLDAKPKAPTDPLNLLDAEDRIRAAPELKDNPDALKLALAGLKERASAYEYQKKQQGNALEASVNGLILQGASAAQVRASTQFLQLSASAPEDARKVLTFMENQDYVKVARAAASEQRADAAESRKERALHRDTISEALRLSDPNVLVGMTRDEVMNKLPVLGVASTTVLLNKWEAYTKNGAALSEAKIDNDQFNVFAVRAGLDPNSKSDDMKKRIVVLRDKIETIVGAEQQALKRPLDRAKRNEIMQREIDNEVMQHNFWRFDKKMPAIVLPEKELPDAYVEVGPANQKVKLSEVPASFRQEAVLSRQRQGLGTSEKQIAELWLRKQGKFKEVR